jgi:hypothetical protein
MSSVRALTHVRSAASAIFGSILIAMQEARRRRAEQIIEEWNCDRKQYVSLKK